VGPGRALRAFRTYRERAGLTNPSRFVHNLRHYSATALFRAGVNPRVAQEFLGHAGLTTTMRYAHVDAHDLRSGVARLETFVASQAPEDVPPDRSRGASRSLEQKLRKGFNLSGGNNRVTALNHPEARYHGSTKNRIAA